jgi:phage FluMu gp28-like protein
MILNLSAHLLPYQIDYLRDQSRLKIVKKSRREMDYLAQEDLLKAKAEAVAAQVTAAASQGGLSQSTIAMIESQILGIVR